MALDLLIRNRTIVDGSGAARYRGDVGVRGDQIVEIGRIRSVAERTIDAAGLIVGPGFIDGRTHMDAQVSWDLDNASAWELNDRGLVRTPATRRTGCCSTRSA